MKAVVSMRSTNGDAAKQLAIPSTPTHRYDLNAIRKSIEATCADTGRTTRPPPAPHVPASLPHRPAGNPHSSDSSAVYKDEAASAPTPHTHRAGNRDPADIDPSLPRARGRSTRAPMPPATRRRLAGLDS